MNFSPPNSLHLITRKKAIALVFALVVWSLFLWRAVDVIGPDGGHIDVNSDSAIPVLMANDARPITVFDTYYYGADRWGGWPLIIARLINHSTGFRWSFERLHAARAIWLFLGVLILALLNRRAALPVVLIGLAVLCLPYLMRLRLFDVGQVYAWQITTLLLSWLALRKWFEQFSASGTGIQTNVAPAARKRKRGTTIRRVPVIAVGAVVIYFWLRRRTESLTSVRQLFLDDTSFTILCALAIAAINFAIVTLVDHVRISLYDNRYLTITFFFGSLAGFLVIWRALKFALEQTRARNYAEPVFASIILVLMLVAFPARLQANAYNLKKETALTLAEKSPNAVLMGGYWETYLFSALQPTNMMTPLPLEGYQVRMPWARTTLHEASEVIVEYKHSGVGDAEPPPERLIQYGESLRLADPKWYENSEYAFARYVKEPK